MKDKWCAMCGQWGDHSSGNCPELSESEPIGDLNALLSVCPECGTDWDNDCNMFGCWVCGYGHAHKERVAMTERQIERTKELITEFLPLARKNMVELENDPGNSIRQLQVKSDIKHLDELLTDIVRKEW